MIYNLTKIINGKRIYPKVSTLRIGIYPLVMYLSKHSCLTKEINEKIEYVVTSGLIEKWTAEYKEISNFDRLDKKIPRTLNITHLTGVFQLYALFLIVASIIFILEIVAANGLVFHL